MLGLLRLDHYRARYLELRCVHVSRRIHVSSAIHANLSNRICHVLILHVRQRLSFHTERMDPTLLSNADFPLVDETEILRAPLRKCH